MSNPLAMYKLLVPLLIYDTVSWQGHRTHPDDRIDNPILLDINLFQTLRKLLTYHFWLWHAELGNAKARKSNAADCRRWWPA